MNLFLLKSYQEIIILIKQALAITVVAFLSVGCSDHQVREVTVVGYNYTVRPMTFSVGSVAGHLYTGEGGGGFLCCTTIDLDEPLLVNWTYNRTFKQYELGLKIEKHTAIIPVDNIESERSGYLEVHFFPDNHVEMYLVDFPTKYPKVPYPKVDE